MHPESTTPKALARENAKNYKKSKKRNASKHANKCNFWNCLAFLHFFPAFVFCFFLASLQFWTFETLTGGPPKNAQNLWKKMQILEFCIFWLHVFLHFCLHCFLFFSHLYFVVAFCFLHFLVAFVLHFLLLFFKLWISKNKRYSLPHNTTEEISISHNYNYFPCSEMNT